MQQRKVSSKNNVVLGKLIIFLFIYIVLFIFSVTLLMYLDAEMHYKDHLNLFVYLKKLSFSRKILTFFIPFLCTGFVMSNK